MRGHTHTHTPKVDVMKNTLRWRTWLLHFNDISNSNGQTHYKKASKANHKEKLRINAKIRAQCHFQNCFWEFSIIIANNRLTKVFKRVWRFFFFYKSFSVVMTQFAPVILFVHGILYFYLAGHNAALDCAVCTTNTTKRSSGGGGSQMSTECKITCSVSRGHEKNQWKEKQINCKEKTATTTHKTSLMVSCNAPIFILNWVCTHSHKWQNINEYVGISRSTYM